MCLFTTKREDRYVRNWDDPARHSSYYSVRPDGTRAVQARLPEASFRRSTSRRRSVSRTRREIDYEYDYEPRPRRSGQLVEYDRRVSREIEYGGARPRSSRSSLPSGYVREARVRY
jgi:hypothetical protein